MSLARCTASSVISHHFPQPAALQLHRSRRSVIHPLHLAPQQIERDGDRGVAAAGLVDVDRVQRVLFQLDRRVRSSEVRTLVRIDRVIGAPGTDARSTRSRALIYIERVRAESSRLFSVIAFSTPTSVALRGKLNASALFRVTLALQRVRPCFNHVFPSSSKASCRPACICRGLMESAIRWPWLPRCVTTHRMPTSRAP